LDNHVNDSRVATALERRCFDRASLNKDLPLAMSDCNAALRRAEKNDPSYANGLAGRAEVRFRMGDYDKAIQDTDEALKLMPKNATALYLRGVAEARKGKQADSDKDLAASKELSPKLAERYATLGIAP